MKHMEKRAFEVPDDIAQWEDTVLEYIDKHYPYLSGSVKNISFSKKEEPTKDGIGAAQYKNGNIEITIPIIIDDGELKEPNIGMYKDQIVPISEDMFKWIMDNTQNFGELIQRDSQHISDVDYLQQTGLFEEPDVGGYKAACLKETADRIMKEASQYDNMQWLVDKLSKVASYATDERIVAIDMGDMSKAKGVYSGIGEYAKTIIGSMPKLATVIANPGVEHKLSNIPAGKSPYMRQEFSHKYSDIYPILKNATEGEGTTENKLIQISGSDTFGDYNNVLASHRGEVNTFSGRVMFDVKPLIEKKKSAISMVIVMGEPKSADPSPALSNSLEPSMVTTNEDKMHYATAIIGDCYGIKTGFHGKKEGNNGVYPPFEMSYNMGDNVMFHLGENQYSTPYIVESKVGGMIGEKMENVVVITILSPTDYTKMDVIVSDASELKTIRKSTIKNKHLLSMFRTDSPTVLMVPSGSVVRAPFKLMAAADKGKMVADIIGGMQDTNMSVVAKIAGSSVGKSYEIVFNDGDKEHSYITTREKVANELCSYFVGEDITADKLHEEGKVRLIHNPEQVKLAKVANIISENTDAYIAVAGKINKSISRHFAKVADVSGIVDNLIGVSFVDSARDTDTKKISEQVMSLINTLGSLILMARLGKTTVPESEINRAFWSLSEMLNVLRG